MKWFRLLINIGLVLTIVAIPISLFWSDEIADAFTGFGSLIALIGVVGYFVAYMLHGLKKK
jgi:hypothetical protein